MLQQQTQVDQLKWKIAKLTPSLEPKHNLPQLVDINNLCNLLGFSSKYPWFVIHNTNQCYREFYIDKDTKQVHHEFNEDLNLRKISAPSEALKEFQGRIAGTLLNKLPRHDSNFAYMKGKNIRMAAEAHVNGEVLIRIDLKDFFPSHRESYVRRRLAEITNYNNDICWFITKICSLNGELPQGSVTSPILSIVTNYMLDEAAANLAAEYNLTYTRYADDLCFSGIDRDNKSCWQFIKEVARLVFPFKVNWDKVAVMRNKSYSYNCGLVIKEPLSIDDLVTLEEMYEETFDVKIKGNSLELISKHREPVEDDILDSMIMEIKQVNPAIDPQPNKWFVQSIKRMLGLHLTAGIKFPRAKYNKLRIEAMLVAKGADNVNAQRFRGRLSFLRMVDPAKASKIDAILSKHGGTN